MQKHQIPVSAIPCLSYRRALEEEKRLKEKVLQNELNEIEEKLLEDAKCENSTNDGIDTNTTTGDDGTKSETIENAPPAKRLKAFGQFTNAKIETVNENLKEQSLTVQQINDYCKSLFIFKNIRVMRFS